jgi:serine/threonine protein kinase
MFIYIYMNDTYNDFLNKYLKYKNKYINLKNKLGGLRFIKKKINIDKIIDEYRNKLDEDDIRFLKQYDGDNKAEFYNKILFAIANKKNKKFNINNYIINESWIKDYKNSTKKLLGKGGYGKVYEFNYHNKKHVVKEIEKRRISKNSSVSIELEHEFLLNFKYPFSAFSNFKLESDDDSYYIMMNNIKGGDLFAHLWESPQMKNNYTFNIKESLRFFIQMVFINYYMHSNGLVHLDIKPENYMVEKIKGKYYIYIIDFGLSSCLRNKKGSLCENRNREANEVNKKFLNVNRGTPAYKGYSMAHKDDKYYTNYSDDYFAIIITFLLIYSSTFVYKYDVNINRESQLKMKHNIKYRQEFLAKTFRESIDIEKKKGNIKKNEYNAIFDLYKDFIFENTNLDKEYNEFIYKLDNNKNIEELYKEYHRKLVSRCLNHFSDFFNNDYKTIINDIFDYIDTFNHSILSMEDKRDKLIDLFENLESKNQTEISNLQRKMTVSEKQMSDYISDNEDLNEFEDVIEGQPK